MIDSNAIKNDFPIFKRLVNNEPLCYLDNSATSQKPQIVIDAISNFYTNHNANINRGIHTLSEEATISYEITRSHLAKYINCSIEEIIFTRNATESINLVMYTWAEGNINTNGTSDVILTTEMEHHSNIVPWQVIAKKKEARLEWVKISKDYRLDLEDLKDKLNIPNVKLLCVTYVSNVLGTINPIKEIVKLAHKKGVKVLVDACQIMPSQKIDVKDLDCDFLVFSAHKMLGPTGVGVLYSKKEILEGMEPFLFGGDMILEVHKEDTIWNRLPNKFEAGTPNIADVIALDKALDYLEPLINDIPAFENELVVYGLMELSKIKGLKIIGPSDAKNRLPIFSFTLEGIHPHDLSQILDDQGIAVRSGLHCAEPLHEVLEITSTTRASLYIYNSKEDIDKLILGINKAKKIFKLD
ncbi:MAG: SufS family cysteine desulfurase [bacterium]